MALPRIALLDDEAPVRVALGRLLRLAGYEVFPYASGEEFLAAMAGITLVPDCAVLDVHLPGLTGLEVQQRLQSGQIQMPVILITASEDADIDRQAQEAGGLCVLRKPFSGDELLASVASALQRRAGPTL